MGRPAENPERRDDGDDVLLADAPAPEPEAERTGPEPELPPDDDYVPV